MTHFNIHEAKTHFSKLLERALLGEEIIICKSGEPYVTLQPIKKKMTGKRQLGWAAGMAEEIDPDWWKPMTDKEVDEMFGL